MFRKERAPAREIIESVIGPTSSFNGHLKCEGGIRIDGIFEGTVETKGNVIIGEEAKVMADITAENISVSGAVKGNLTANARLEILSTGRVWGDISVASFLIDEGGFFRGQSIMPGEPEPFLIEAPREPTVEAVEIQELGD